MAKHNDLLKRHTDRSQKHEDHLKEYRTAQYRIIRKAYIRLVLICVATLLATNVCGFIDNIVIGRYLDAQALAAVGFFSPMSAVIGCYYVIILGTTILCGNLIGAGKQDKVISLFTSSFLVLCAAGFLCGTLMIVFRGTLATVLGARGEAHRLLCQYLTGYAPCIAFSSLSALLISLASFNNEINRTYIATAVMFLGNLAGDLLLVRPFGLLGVGLASTLSTMTSFLILLPAYMRPNKTIHLIRSAPDLRLLGQVCRRGLPTLLLSIGLVVKNGLLNYTLSVYAGYEAIAVVNVLGSVSGITGTATGGFSNAFMSFASLLYGEEDREGLVGAFRFAARLGMACMTLMTAVMVIFSGPLSGLFFETGTDVWRMGQRMFILGFLYLPINILINLLMNAYKAQGKMRLVNVLSFAEVGMVGILALPGTAMAGIDAAWLATPWSELLTLAVILISVWTGLKHFSLKAADLLKLPPHFGAAPGEFVEFSIGTIQEVVDASADIVAFCRSKGIDSRKSFWAGLCVEEMAANALMWGAKPGKRSNVSVRIVCKDELTIRIEDDCRRFDPRERMKMYHPETPEKNIGLRMTAALSTSHDYYNNAGINTLILKI